MNLSINTKNNSRTKKGSFDTSGISSDQKTSSTINGGSSKIFGGEQKAFVGAVQPTQEDEGLSSQGSPNFNSSDDEDNENLMSPEIRGLN